MCFPSTSLQSDNITPSYMILFSASCRSYHAGAAGVFWRTAENGVKAVVAKLMCSVYFWGQTYIHWDKVWCRTLFKNYWCSARFANNCVQSSWFNPELSAWTGQHILPLLLSLLAKHNWWPTKVLESVRQLVSAAITGFFDLIVFWVCFIVCMAEKHISPPGFRELRACVWVKYHVKVVLVCCFLMFLRSHPNSRLARYHFGVKFPLHSVLGWLRVLCWRKEIAFSPVNSSKSTLGF